MRRGIQPTQTKRQRIMGLLTVMLIDLIDYNIANREHRYHPEPSTLDSLTDEILRVLEVSNEEANRDIDKKTSKDTEESGQTSGN